MPITAPREGSFNALSLSPTAQAHGQPGTATIFTFAQSRVRQVGLLLSPWSNPLRIAPDSVSLQGVQQGSRQCRIPGRRSLIHPVRSSRLDATLQPRLEWPRHHRLVAAGPTTRIAGSCDDDGWRPLLPAASCQRPRRHSRPPAASGSWLPAPDWAVLVACCCIVRCVRPDGPGYPGHSPSAEVPEPSHSVPNAEFARWRPSGR